MLLVVFPPAVSVAENPTVIIRTSKGDIGVMLYSDKSPVSVANFLSYVDAGAYDRNIFHRVIAGFMIQTGGYFEDLSSADVGESLYNEADNGLRNVSAVNCIHTGHCQCPPDIAEPIIGLVI